MRISEKAKKRRFRKKRFMAVVVSMMVCLLFCNTSICSFKFYSKTTTKLNAINGGKSTTSRLVGDLVDNNHHQDQLMETMQHLLQYIG